MVYTEADIFREAAADRKRLLKWDARKYKEVWLAFCKWIVERFDRAKGVNIINLMSLSWEPDELEEEIYGGGGGRALRPVWRLNAAFERGYNLQCKNKADKRTPNDEASFEKMEEINFHKIAMRYSNTLTKDVAFSCLREMFSRLGKAMMTGQHVKVFCGVGDFVCRDRKAEFEFDSHYHRFIIRKVHDDAPSETTERVVPIHGSAAIESPVPSVSKVSFAGEQTNKSRGDILVIGGEGREGGERGGPEESLGGKGGKQEEAVCADEDALGLSMEMMGLKTQTRDAEEDEQEEQLELLQVYNGAANDETWRLERVDRQAGGEEKKRFVGQILLQKEASALEQTADLQVRNVLLGEQRRVEATKQEEASEQAKRLEIMKTAPLAKQRILEAEAAKKAADREERMGVREDPFYIHLEPDPIKVLNDKKNAQKQMRTALEEQIARRLMTSQREAERRSYDKKQMEMAEVTLHRSLESEYAKKRSDAVRLKQEWAQQVQHKTKAKSLARLPDICLVDKSVRERMLKVNA